MRIVHRNTCHHCGAIFTSGCVIKFICYDCEKKGHNEGIFSKCQKCEDENPKITIEDIEAIKPPSRAA